MAAEQNRPHFAQLRSSQGRAAFGGWDKQECLSLVFVLACLSAVIRLALAIPEALTSSAPRQLHKPQRHRGHIGNQQHRHQQDCYIGQR